MSDVCGKIIYLCFTIATTSLEIHLYVLFIVPVLIHVLMAFCLLNMLIVQCFPCYLRKLFVLKARYNSMNVVEIF